MQLHAVSFNFTFIALQREKDNILYVTVLLWLAAHLECWCKKRNYSFIIESRPLVYTTPADACTKALVWFVVELT